MDQVSSHGYAWGYLGSCIPFIVSLAIVLFYDKLGLTMAGAMAAAFCFTALWWLAVTLPLLRHYRQVNFAEKSSQNAVSVFSRLAHSFGDLKQNPKILVYLMAFFFYIDGVYTNIDMANCLWKRPGGWIPKDYCWRFCLLRSWHSHLPFYLEGQQKTHPAGKLIKFCILAYIGIALFAIQLDKQWEFWVLAVCVGMFEGAIQALSRSYFAKIIPPEKSGEFFGIFDICGKGAAFLGTALVGIISQATGNPSMGVGVLAVLFTIGLLIFCKAEIMD